ncbi:MAG: Gfo/Idh/MocA family protein [Nocardioidaceae bacterium]
MSADPGGIVGIGLIGAGAMGADHARTLSTRVPGNRLVAVYDAVRPRATEVAAGYGAAVADSAKAVIEDVNVHGVVIAAPDSTHEELVLAALEAGKYVLCEKPLADGVPASRRIIDAEMALGRRLLQVGFMRRFDPGYLGMKEALTGGEIGDPLLLHCRHRNAEAPNLLTSEMIIRNSMVHELDTVRWLLGEEIVAVTVRSPRPVSDPRRDPQLAWLEMYGGAIAEVEVFVTCGYGYEVGCELVGSSGAVSLVTSPPVRTVREGRDSLAVPADFRRRFAEAYRVELAGWVASVAAGSAVGPDAWDGHAANIAGQACVESLHSGERVPVEMAARPGLYVDHAPMREDGGSR